MNKPFSLQSRFFAISNIYFWILLSVGINLPLFQHVCFAYAPVELIESDEIPKKDSLWLTGPILSPTTDITPPGHVEVQPFVFSSTIFGEYKQHWNTKSVPNFYSQIFETGIEIGIVNAMQCELYPTFTWNYSDGASQWVINDFVFDLNIQLYEEKDDQYWPSINLIVQASALIGKYQNLNPKKKETDIGGAGTWSPTAGIAISKLFHLKKEMFFLPQFYISYTIPNSVSVKNLNFYGGEKGTRGTVYPGNFLTLIYGMQLSFTQNWAFACDVQYLHYDKTRFKGKTDERVGFHSSEQLSIAPAFEYNFSENLGLLAGAWFTLAGRNTDQFASGVLSIMICW